MLNEKELSNLKQTTKNDVDLKLNNLMNNAEDVISPQTLKTVNRFNNNKSKKTQFINAQTHSASNFDSNRHDNGSKKRNRPNNYVNYKKTNEESIQSTENKEFLLNTFKKYNERLNEHKLNEFIQNEYDRIMNEFENTKIELEKSRKSENINSDLEQRKALACELKLAERKIESFEKEIQRLDSIYEQNPSKIYYAYEREFDRARRNLPFYAYRTEIIEKLKVNDVLVIIGQTGSGKTTQVPQYLLEYGFANDLKIVATQPRRIATETVSTRIADEMKCSNTKLISHKLFTSKKPTDEERHKFNKQNKLLFMTDKNLLSEYKRDKMLSKYSCVIVDEAHERTLFTDILLAELKTLVNKRKSTNKPLKLIIMSATIDENKFSKYFNNCPIIQVPGQTYPVKVYNEPKQANYLLQTVNKVKELIQTDRINGDVLVFLPTIDDINKADKELNEFIYSSYYDQKYVVLPLHGKLEPEEQARVFKEQNNKYKIIFSTNLAETSVTIKGVRIVIDSGRAKERTYDQNRNISVFKIKLITQSSAIQRKGRAGRCSAGVCYRLYSSQDYQDMEPILEPEIFRMHLGIVILQLLSCGIENLFDYDLIDKPTHEALQNSMQKLESLQMIKEKKITDYGLIASELYLEPSISRIIIEGLELGVGNEMLKIAAMMTITHCLYSRSINFDEREMRKLSSSQVEGDFVSLLNIFNEFEGLSNAKARFSWCSERQYAFFSLNSARQVYNELYSSLAKIKNSSLASSIRKNECKKGLDLILKSICSGLHMNLAYFNGKIKGKNVYRIVELDHDAFICNESVLYSLGDDDYEHRFLLFSDLYSTENLFMRNITPVTLEMLSGYTERDFLSLKNSVRVKISRKISESIVDSFKSLEFRSISNELNLNLVEKLERELGYEVMLSTNRIETYVPQIKQKFAADLIEKYVNEIKLKFTNELFEYRPEDDHDDTSYKVFFKSSLDVQNILFNGQYLRINFYDLPLSTEKSFLFSLFAQFGNILDFKMLKTSLAKINGYVLYDDYKNAKLAFDKLNKYPILEDSTLSLKPSSNLDGSMVFRNTHVKAVWFLNQPTGTAYVTFSKNTSLLEVNQRLQSVGYISFIHNLPERKIKIINIFKSDKFMDEINFKKCISQFGQVEELYLAKKPINEINLAENKEIEKLKIEAFFQRYGSLRSIYITPYGFTKTGKIKPQARVYLNYESEESIDRIITELNNKEIPADSGIMGFGRMHLSKNILREFKVPNKVANMLDVKSIQEVIKIQHFSILTHKQKVDKFENDLFLLKSIDQLKLNEAVRYMSAFLAPSSIQLSYFKFIQLKKLLNKNKFQEKLEAKYKAVIIKDPRYNKVNVYGEDKQKVADVLMKEINDLFTQSVTIRISSFKAIWGWNGETFGRLQDEFGGEMSLDFKEKVVRFSGNENQIEPFRKRVKELEAEYTKKNQLKLATNLKLCPICTDEIKNPFRLILCEHEFCFECISSQFKSYDMNSSSLNCLVCNKEISLSDLKCLARNDMSLFNQKCSIALSKYMLNQNKYMYCSLNSCNKICEKVKEGQIYCQQCEDYLNWSSEREAELKINDELYQEFINSNKDVKKCPNEECKKPIMKNKGCNHMQCFYCKVHFCWTCLFRSTTENDIYDHMRKEHDGIGIDALDLDGLILDDMDFEF